MLIQFDTTVVLNIVLIDTVNVLWSFLSRVSATRHMCSVLKDHITRTENRLDSCEFPYKILIKTLHHNHLISVFNWFCPERDF